MPPKLVLGVVVLFFLLASIPAAIFLVGQRQEIREKAVGFAVDGFDGENWNIYGEGCFGGASPYAQIPPGWRAWNLQVNRCVQRESFIKRGTYSIKITNKHLMGQPKGEALGGIYKEDLKVIPGARYTLKGESHRFYDESADFIGFQFCSAASCRNIDWRPLYGYHRVEGGDPNVWYSFEETAIAPSDASNLNVFLAGGINQFIGESNPNDVYFDNVELIETTPPTTPTPTTAQCLAIKTYDTSWNLLTATQLSQLKSGDTVRFAVLGQTSSGTFDKARFRVNSTTWLPETTMKKPGTEEFYIEYTIPTGVTSFKVEAEIYHSILGWQ